MGLKAIFNRAKENLKPVPDSPQENTSTPMKLIWCSVANAKNLDEVIELYGKLLLEGSFEKYHEWDYRNVVSVYDQLIDTCMADKKSLVEKLTKFFALRVINISERIWAIFFAGLYIVCKKYQLSYAWFVDYLGKIRYSPSFSAFDLVCEAAKVYNFNVDEAKKDIEVIWQEQFNALCYNSNNDAFSILKKADMEMGHNWGEYLYSKLSVFDSWAEASKWDYSYDYAKGISRNYPELTAYAFRHLILYFLYEFEEFFEESEIEEKSKTLIMYLQHIEALANNACVEFEFKNYWRQIIKKIFALLDGNALTVAIEVLNKVGHIPYYDMHKYITDQTLYFLSGSSNMTYNGVKLVNDSDYCVEEISYIERLKVIHRLLSNKIVFSVVMWENYAIIQAFNYGA